MAGLLDKFGGNPEQRGLLAGAAALMRASGPSRLPVPLGQALGKALVAGQTAYLNSQRQRGVQDRLSQRLPRPHLSQPADAATEVTPPDLPMDAITSDADETPVQRFNRQVRASRPAKATQPTKQLMPAMPGKQRGPELKRQLPLKKTGIDW